ncbi:MAG: alpha/beta fold hydrolase [Brevibacterium aurantiacum]|uniref:Pimeloyl-ACP methyl ester carboxylesterase n=1 Tax=Brevibacterium aurantiacum TaxID=273384 RepID=A0A2H1KGQ4_BREAU|nr:alpha/beta hydrolase [Brevibacterium aurantiacum]AZL06923.1 alpha/beta hydrolase [Brevibacterium aurantiacum]AZL14155.1 alpha/beta hydrolase [Brevibacterium aurantiacum]SMX98829.1 Pimeloyl-ACP methyl ester carboxylesterase [Brevibacterium aurantiacum]
MTQDLNLPGPETDFIATFGNGEPHTLFGHGFAGAIRDTRPFGTGITGTKHFLHLPGHGGRPSPGPGWNYGQIAEVLAQALTSTSATQALGVSMSAGGLLRLLSTGHPVTQNLEKVALVLPASFTGFSAEVAETNRAHLEKLRELSAAGDVESITDLMLSREPAEVAELLPARAWTKTKAENLVNTDMSDGLGLALEIAVDASSGDNPLGTLARFPGEVLVLTHDDDPAHPVEVAEAVVAAIPDSRLEVLPAGSILWRGRHEVRRILGEFFG